MSEPSNKDPLDILLQEQNVYVEDNGFTARVVASLPRRRRSSLQMILLAVSIIGWIVAAWCLPWGNLPPLDTATLISLNSQALLPWITASMVIACLAWSTVAAVQGDD